VSDAATVVLALSAAAGAWLGRPWPLLPVAVMAVVALGLRRPALLCLAAALGASALAARSEAGLRPPAVGPFDGVVTLVSDPDEMSGAVRAEVRVRGKRVEAWSRGPAAWRFDDRLAGERVRVTGDLQPVPAAARSRLARRHVAGRLTIRSVGAWSPGDAPSRLANRVRRTLLTGAASLAPERRALFSGFVLGDDRGQPAEVTDDFRAAGLSHLLVVSGQNVAFVLALAAPLLRRLRLGPRLAAGMVVLFLFGVAVRWEPSVLRASAMAGLALVTATLGRPTSSVRILALAVTALLLVDPLLVGSVSFLLSVGASAGIAVLARPLEAVLPGPGVVARAVSVTLAAQVGVAPVLVPIFGGLPVASLPANLLAVPVAGPLMVWGLAAGLAAGVIGDPVARWVHVPTDLMVRWVAGVARWFGALPLGQLGLGHVALLAGVAGLALVCRRRGWRAGTVLAGAGTAALLVAPAVAMTAPPSVDGRAVAPGARLWRTAGAAVLVVDDLEAAPDRLLSGLRAASVRRLDVMVVARPGIASAREVEATLRRFGPRLLLAPPGHRLVGAVTPSPGTTIAAGPLAVAVDAAGPRLAVRVSPRAPPR